MPKRKCDACGKEKDVRGGKVCSNGHLKISCQRENVMLVVKKRMFVEEKYVLMGTSYVQVVFMVDFSDQHEQHAHYVGNL
jgi:hypothetical protein